MKTNRSKYNYYNKDLQPFAHANRYRMTKAEACLWKYGLRAQQMKGYRFTRQRPVLNYIADFMCKELKLVIETDGITHLLQSVMAKDLKKTKALEKAGFVVMRFNDNEVLREIDDVVKRINLVIEQIETSRR